MITSKDLKLMFGRIESLGEFIGDSYLHLIDIINECSKRGYIK